MTSDNNKERRATALWPTSVGDAIDISTYTNLKTAVWIGGYLTISQINNIGLHNSYCRSTNVNVAAACCCTIGLKIRNLTQNVQRSIINAKQPHTNDVIASTSNRQILASTTTRHAWVHNSHHNCWQILQLNVERHPTSPALTRKRRIHTDDESSEDKTLAQDPATNQVRNNDDEPLTQQPSKSTHEIS